MGAAANLDSVLYAMSDRTRRKVLERLSRGSASVSELAKPFDLAMPSFMQHLDVLQDSGLIRTQKEGRVRTCYLVPDRLKIVEGWLEEQRQIWETRTRAWVVF